MKRTSKAKLSSTEIAGLVEMVKDSTINVTDIAEELNRRIAEPPGLPSGPIRRTVGTISGMVYSMVRSITNLVGLGVEKSILKLNPSVDSGLTVGNKEVLRSVLNGVLGDYLVNKNNPLAIPMQFRYQGEAIELNSDHIHSVYPKTGGKILLIIHGLCMNDVQWTRKNHNHGEQLAKELGLTPLYLYYNGGLHISDNGKQLSALLEKLIISWPVPVEQLVLLTHSMGGLLARSALYYGEKARHQWTNSLSEILFLGTPHHGAPLERMGNYVDQFLDATPFTKPFSRLGKLRSPGITDLRFGNLVDEDWNTFDRFEKRIDERQHFPLPQDARCYAIAAAIGKKEDAIKTRVWGDGLVPINSALGIHPDPERCLNFHQDNTRTYYETSHLDLLSSRAIYEQIRGWVEE